MSERHDNQGSSDRYDVTAYLSNGCVEDHLGVSETRANQIENTFGASEAILRIDVTPAKP